MNAYASANWLVKEGQEDDFVGRWWQWLEWTRESVEGFKWARLLRSADDPRRFVSFSEWESEETRTAWKNRSEFQDRFRELRAMTDEFIGGDYNEEMRIGAKTVAQNW